MNTNTSSDNESLLSSGGGISSSYTFTKPKTPQSITQHTSYSGSVESLSSGSSAAASADDDLSYGSKSIYKDDDVLHRHLTLVDLISIGVAATVGSGIFVLCGLIGHDFAGPSTFICWGIAGISCCASGLCYAELSGKIAVSGSTYTYVKMTMGELASVAAGACMTFEYLFASSAVARSWGDKVVAFIEVYHSQNDQEVLKILKPGNALNPMAFLISTAAVILLLRGVKESKQVTNFFTFLKIILIGFMSAVALSLLKKENFIPMLPSQFGVTGILRGSTSSFFGYIGFDEICCLGDEVINPQKNLPRGVLGTIAIVTFLYIVAAIGLAGMVPYTEMSVTSGFPDGFRYRGYEAIGQITALGEIVTLPIVVLVTLMAQPRLQYAMAKDGLLPSIFARVDETGNLWWGTFIAGVISIIISTCVPFTYLNDLISAGVLMAFSMAAASVILMRHQSPVGQPFLLEKLLIKFNVLSFTMGLSFQFGFTDMTGAFLPVINFLMLIGLTVKIGSSCPEILGSSDPNFFQTPLVPYLPLFAQFLNWYLVGQLSPFSILLLIGYVGTAIALYWLFKKEKYPSIDNLDSRGHILIT